MARKPRRPAPDQPPEEGLPLIQFSVWRWLRNSFFTGIVVATPITVTTWLILTFISFVDKTVKPLIPRHYLPQDSLVYAIPGVGLLVAVVALTLLGAFTANIIGRSLIQFGERLVGRVPFVREIYGLVKQVLETVFQANTKAFKQVVLLQYPRPGLWTIGFLSAPARGELERRLSGGEDEEYLGVFVPTIPNPTSGFILWARRSEVQILDMTVEEGAKLILSAGIVTPELARAQAETRRTAPPVRPG